MFILGIISDVQQPRIARGRVLRTTAALHGSVVLWHIAAETLFLLTVTAPFFFERMKRHVHDAIDDIAFTPLLDSIDELVKDP